MKKQISISADVTDLINYASQQNGCKIIRDVCLKNETKSEIKNMVLQITTDIDLIEPFERVIDVLQAGEELHIRDLKIIMKGDYLASLTERVTGALHMEILQECDVLAAETFEIIALAYDEWSGSKYFPDLLTAFVTPNHPVVIELIHAASKWMEKWTGNPSIDGYQCKDVNRVKKMAAAVFAAIQERNITYAVPPASFEDVGQRVRLADAIMEQHLATCLDLTLLYTACLEAMGLNPFMVLMKGHIFGGLWLVDNSFADPIEEDPSQLEKRMASGIHEVLVVECTQMCAGITQDFDGAVQSAKGQLSQYEKFYFAIDVLRSRKSGIRPLPIRIKTDTGFVIDHGDRDEKDVTSDPNALGTTYKYDNTFTDTQVTKVVQWERKLLDLSLRNMLINMRLTKNIVPLLSTSISDFEDALAEGEEFKVLPRPLEWEMNGVSSYTLESTNELGPYADLIALECKHRKLHTIYPAKELNSALTKIYRSAKTSMEENGASTLYLVLGLLRWFEKKTSTVPRYAPIVMVPIDIARKSASRGYVLRMKDEDAQINITLLEFLKQNFNIKIRGLDPLPVDEHGLDIKKIFAAVRFGVMEETMWDVIESGFIGNFSFSQFVMWNDIHNNEEKLERNKIVRSLMHGAIDWDCTIPEAVNTDEAYLPITADSSQLHAINMAANEVSFVLHGPPGTGKSQTITAMISNALTKGKTVLFVAEKMAALEVVQKRLAALGIGDFCLELHSNKAVKKSVLNQLKRALEISENQMDTQYDRKIEDIRQMRVDLDAYVQKLHKRRLFGKSLRELIDLYELVPDHEKEVRFDGDYASSLSQSDLDMQRQLLERLVAVGRAVGHPCDHPLSEVKQTVYSQSLKMNLKDTVQAYRTALETYEKEAMKFAAVLKLAQPSSEDQWKLIYTYAVNILSIQNIPDFLIEADSLEKEFLEPKQYLMKYEAFQKKKNTFMEQWNENFLRMDMGGFQKRYEEAGRKIFGKGRAFAALTAELQAYASFPVTTDQIPVLLTDVVFYQKEQKELEEQYEQLSEEWKQILSKYKDAAALQEYKNTIKKQLIVVSQFLSTIELLKAEDRFQACQESAQKILEEYKQMQTCEESVVNLLNVVFADKEEEGENWLESRIHFCNKLLENSGSIKEWIVYKQYISDCEKHGLKCVCDAYESGLPHEQVVDVYQRSIYKAIILSVIEQEPVLNSFTGTGFNERILQFKKLDEEFMTLTKEEMFYQLSKNLPTGYESVTISKELNILRRAITSNGRGLSLRALFEQIPNVLMKLAPCMLMSPISVAQYLTMDTELFDIVIFDEASQLPTCKAVGVLARGKNAVIVGDPNQMPPTSFFAGNTVDEDNLDIEDLDSILDDCLALGMPQSHLRWHYRSRHESLIAFSNQEFYENSMYTFPSVNDREKRVNLVKVEGFFERGRSRINMGEAKAIVQEILRRYKDPVLKEQSMGVVTFNINQQILIEDLLQEEYKKDLSFDQWANMKEEPLFVKNLENVQGDERDVILFSVAFGPDAEGKMSMNFGPLNREGGWKRLNVAVSRARSEMMVFSVMSADQINLKRTRAKGVESLRAFLEFAEKGEIKTAFVPGMHRKNQGILERICRELTDKGYQYQKSVGHSDFKVDIAVINPYDQDEYLLGIMLDGESYRQSANTKDREISQISVLEGLGWKLHRIWTMDWWDNKEKELAKILARLEELKKAAEDTVSEESETEEEIDFDDTNESPLN